MHNLKTTVVTVTGLIMMLGSLPLRSATPAEEQTVTWYDVEIIIFRNLDTRSTETWPPDAGVPDVGDARPLFPPISDAGDESRAQATPVAPASSEYPSTPTPYTPFETSALKLTGVANSLQRSSKYEPLLHTAWTQPPLERGQAPYLRVTLPDAFATGDESGSAATALFNETETQGEIPDDTLPEFLREDDDSIELARPLDGVVQLSVSRYLHLDLDLLYLPDDLNVTVLRGAEPAREWTEEEKLERERRRRDILEALARGDITVEEAEILSLEPDEQRFQGFRLNQYRRLRSREMHYFDHPVYGAIVMVTPREVSARTMELDAGAPGQ